MPELKKLADVPELGKTAYTVEPTPEEIAAEKAKDIERGEKAAKCMGNMLSLLDEMIALLNK